jgi:hypothetical protein
MPEPTYLEPGVDIDCAYFIGENEFVRGSVRLPGHSSRGRIRFLEDVYSAVLNPEGNARVVAIKLFDGDSGTPACLINCLLTQHTFSMPFPAAYPLELFVNIAIVGSDDPERRYEQATLRCTDLLDFLSQVTLSPAEVAQGETYSERAKADGDGFSLVIAECADFDASATSASLSWSAEVSLRGEAKPLAEWARELAKVLNLFALLCDQPLVPERVYAAAPATAFERSSAVEFYAPWTQPEAPSTTRPLVGLANVEDRLDQIVSGWLRLYEQVPDLVDHLVEYQLHRNRLSRRWQVLNLFRCLELYHDYAARFESVIRPKPDHRALVDELISGLGDHSKAKHAEWIDAALRQANQKRLVDQVTDILDDLGPELVELCFISDADDFASVCKSARNYYTHPTGRRPSNVPAEGRELLILVNRLWFVVRSCVLLELGFPREQIGAALKQSAQRHYLLK